MYSFVASDKEFMGCSTIYNVYDECNVFIAQFVVGYSIAHNLYYITEYRGADGSPYTVGLQNELELAAILYDFSEIFEYIDYSGIFSNMSVYEDYKDKAPAISKELLYIYDSYGEVTHQDGEWFVIADDEHVEQLIYANAIEGTELFLDEENEESEIIIDLQEDAFYCDGDTIDGFYAKIYWDKIKNLVLINNL